MHSITTSRSPDVMGIIERFLPSIPEISFSVEPVANLRIPGDLFDEKTPAVEEAYADALTPILARKTQTPHAYAIIDGCKRFSRFLKIGQATCPCGIIAQSMSDQQAGLLRILLNQKKQLHVRERVVFLRWLEKNISQEDIQLLAPSLGFSASQRQELAALLTCSEEVLNAVAEGKVSVRAVAQLCLLNQTDQMTFLQAFPDMALSQQTQLEFLQWLPEIAYEKKTSVSALLQCEVIHSIVEGRTLNGPQKIETVRSIFFSWKYPRYSETLKHWKKIASTTAASVLENQPSSSIEFIPNPGFEKNRLELHMTIVHAHAAHEIFERLASISRETWTRLIYPISGT